MVAPGDCAGMATELDYPCRVDLPPAKAAVAAHTLRSDPAILPLLNQRIVGLGTHIGNLAFHDADSCARTCASFAGKP